jgi:acetamidase/formamidase
LPATPDNVQWGWYDINEKPKLTIKSGDTVSIETLSHSLGQIKPGVDMDEIVKLRKGNPGGGPHSITGPIYVEGAEPGDTLEIHILKIVPKADAFNFNVPGKDFPTVGQLAPEFPEGFVRFYKLDLAKMQTPFKPGIVIDLKPFPGTFAVGVDPSVLGLRGARQTQSQGNGAPNGARRFHGKCSVGFHRHPSRVSCFLASI